MSIQDKINLNELATEAHFTAVEHGFWEDIKAAEAIALMHSELSEALECLRKGGSIQMLDYELVDHNTGEILSVPKPVGLPFELADCVIRILDFCGRYKIGIHEAVQHKMQYNKTRAFKHGKKF